jgi:hypothetical protein
MEIENEEYKRMKEFSQFVKKKGPYKLIPKYLGSYKYLDLVKFEERKFLRWNYLKYHKLSESLFFYNDWIFIECRPSMLDEIKRICDGFEYRINIKVWGELENGKS